MRKLPLWVFFFIFYQSIQAQNSMMPQFPSVPKSACFTPALISSPLINNPATTQSLPDTNHIAVYEDDRHRIHAKRLNQTRELQNAVNEHYTPTQKDHYANSTNPSDPRATGYLQAYNEINAMLIGKTPANLKRSVFLVENAYCDNKINYAAYCRRIESLITFCLQKLKEEKADTTNDEAKNGMIFRLLTEPLTVTDQRTQKKKTSNPIHYDFEDFYGNKDWTKMFVTKLLTTGYGQCHSMPLLFNILAQEIGAKAYMSYSPSHSFAKYKIGNSFKNVELTNGHMTSDAWVLASGMIKSEALKNHIYMDTVGLKAQIAYMMQDLAAGYIRKFGSDYFAGKCIETGLKYYPNNACGLGMKANYITTMFQTSVKHYRNMSPEQVLKIPEMKQLYDAMQISYAELDAAGYTKIRPEQYEDWLKSIDKEKREQEYNLFLRYQKKHKNSFLHAIR